VLKTSSAAGVLLEYAVETFNLSKIFKTKGKGKKRTVRAVHRVNIKIGIWTFIKYWATLEKEGRNISSI